MGEKAGQGMQIYIAHSPGDSKLAAALADGLSDQGAEVLTTAQRKDLAGVADPVLDTPERDRTKVADPALEAAARHYLKKLKGPEPMQMERRIFLSYAREDSNHVREFHLELLGMGLLTFMDKSEICGIYASENWIARIFHELSTCCSMAFFLSPHSLQSIPVGYEVGFFLERMKVRSGVFFAVIMLHALDVDHFRQLGIPIIELYRLSPRDAAEEFVDSMVAFYRNLAEKAEEGQR
jgi:hypothetical protein